MAFIRDYFTRISLLNLQNKIRTDEITYSTNHSKSNLFSYLIFRNKFDKSSSRKCNNHSNRNIYCYIFLQSLLFFKTNLFLLSVNLIQIVISKDTILCSSKIEMCVCVPLISLLGLDLLKAPSKPASFFHLAPRAGRTRTSPSPPLVDVSVALSWEVVV